MITIEKIRVDEIDMIFYNGIDIDFAVNHPKDGSSGFIFFFIDNWVKEVKKWERDSKIDTVLVNSNFKKFDTKSLDNNYVSIYQLEGTEPGTLFEIIKDKVINKNFFDHRWISISGVDKGAWKIVNSKVSN